MKKKAIDKWILYPIKRFITNQTSTGFVLMLATVLALVIANSPLAPQYHEIWRQKFTIGFNDLLISKTLIHWINDGLMAIFFFVVGLELKREMLAGELARPREAILPIAAGIGGMIFPALIFLSFNSGDYVSKGWGIPMATDIAFALGILYMLGDKVPFSLKVFLTALAIVDDIGAVLVVAFFYTSDISFFNLGLGAFFMAVLISANYLGVRSTVFFGVIGIGGLWLAFLLSGVHATIAAVLAAFTIPADVKIDSSIFSRKVRMLLNKLNKTEEGEHDDGHGEKRKIVSEEQLDILDKFKYLAKDALTPLQRLEHSLHPLVNFVVLPVFAFANAGVTVSSGFFTDLFAPLSLGIIFGLIVGKFIGIVGFTKAVVSLKLSSLPKNVTWPHIYGVSLLAAVGFTMSLFITDLAFNDEATINQAKIGVLSASILAGFAGFFILGKLPSKKKKTKVSVKV